MGLVAKEEIVGVFSVPDTENLTRLSGYAFLAFNLLCALKGNCRSETK